MPTPEARFEGSYAAANRHRQLPGLHLELKQGGATTSENHFVQMCNGASDLLFLIQVEAGPQFRCLTVNHAFVTKTGWTQEQVVGKLIEEFVPPEHARLVIEKYIAAIQARSPMIYEETVE